MTTQRVITQTAQLFGGAAGSCVSKGKQAGGGFDLVIDSTMKAGSGMVGKADGTGRKAALPPAEKQDRNNMDAAREDAGQAGDTVRSSTKTDSQQAVQTERQSKTVRTAEGKVRTEAEDTGKVATDEATLEKIAAMLNIVRATVMELLNLSAEELDGLLGEQGLELADLLEPHNLQQLVLANHGESDILAVLTDENLADMMNRLIQAVDAVKQDAGLELSLEQIKRMLEDTVLQQDKRNESQEKGIGDETEISSDAGRDKTGRMLSANNEESSAGSVKAEENGLPVSSKLSEAGDSSSESQSQLRGDDEPELRAANQFEAFVNNLSKAADTTQVEAQGNLVRMTEIREIANQIIQRIRVTIQPDQTSMELQLNPEHLGRVNLSLQSKNGIMTAQFVVQNEISREAIESQLHTLRETLNQQGLKVEAIEVSIAANSFEQSNNHNFDEQAQAKPDRSNHRISLEDAVNMTEETQEEASGQDLSGVRGSQIDYTA